MQDVHLALDALRNVVAALENNKQNERTLGHLLSLARLLRSNAVLATSMRELDDDPLARDSRRLEQIESKLLQDGDNVLRWLAAIYKQPLGGGLRSLVANHAKGFALASRQETLAEVLKRVTFGGGAADSAPHHTIDDLTGFAATAKELHRLACENRGAMSDSLPHLALLAQTAEACDRLQRFKRVCATGSLSRIASRLECLLDRWDKLIAEGPLGWPEPWEAPETEELENDARTLLSRIELHLGGLRSQRLVLLRAKAYFEHFYYEDARKIISEEEARVISSKSSGHRTQAQREVMLGAQLKRFLFHEGFFPITQAEAGQGKLDLLLDNATRVGTRPLLVELKQAVRIFPNDVGRREVEIAIADARTAIGLYAGHLSANDSWRHIEPVIVVFHSSIQDVSALEASNVILIGIGSRPPSKMLADERQVPHE